MVKLAGAVILVVLTAILTGFNLDNRSNVWFFHTFEDVPVFFAILAAFGAGIITTLPFVLKSSSGNKSAGSNKKGRREKRGQPVDYDSNSGENSQDL